MKRNIYVFFDQFLDKANTTSPGQILPKLDAVNAYFSEVTHGAWTFNWVLFYPSLGQSWYVANETYVQAGKNPDLTPLANVIFVANQSGTILPVVPLCCYPDNANSAIIFHAGNDGAMTANSTDIWSVTTGPVCSGLTTNPPNAWCFLTAIVAETDPIGVIAHEMTHELQRFDESGNPLEITLGHSTGTLPPGMVPVDWWDIMYQGLRNPTNNASIPRGTYPTEYMAWNRMSLGLLPLPQVAAVSGGRSETIALNDLEEPTSGYQAIRIPIGSNPSHHWYYFVELRKGISYDYYFPWLTNIYPDREGMLVYWVNSSIYGEPFHIFLVKAHSNDVTAQTALFGPCNTPCASSMSMYDAANNINVTITSTSSSQFLVQVNNASNQPFLLVCSNPSIQCFLGFLDFGGLGLLLNATLAFGTGFGLAILATKRRHEKYHNPIVTTN